MSKLSDYCLNITDGEHGSVIDDPKGGYYLLSNKNIANGNIVITNKDRRISKDSFDKINKRTKLEKNDVIISTVGTLGKLAIIKYTPNFNFQRSVGIIKCSSQKLSSEYLYYYLSLKSSQDILINNSKGAVQKCIFINDLKNLSVNFPTIEHQSKIIKPLLLIDSKIELNNKINAELEKIAKTLYDYWFVQFDFPDENNRPYKSSGGAMVYNEELKREIPKGWEVKNISEYCDIIDCLHSKKPRYCYESEDLYLLQLDNLTCDGSIDVSNKYYISSEDYKNWTKKIEIQENDFVCTNAGRIAAIGKIPTNIKCALGRNFTAIRPTRISPYYLRMFFNSIDMQQQILANLDSGAFFKSFNVKSIKKIRLLIAEDQLTKTFVKSIAPIINKVELNSNCNHYLIHIRDFLLPMLMNGQVKVVDN